MTKLKNHYRAIHNSQASMWRNIVWKPVNSPYQIMHAKQLARPMELSWLLEKGSLTTRLLAVSQHELSVIPYHEGWVSVHNDVVIALKLKSHKKVWERLAILYGKQHPWVIAQTLVPDSTLRGSWRKILSLGNQSLGQLIFSGRKLVLAQRYIARVPNGIIIRNLKRQNVECTIPKTGYCWARRSVYQLSSGPLMVAELFLPSLTEIPMQNSESYSHNDQ